MEFNNREVGSLLKAIGTQMAEHDLVFGAVFDGNSKYALTKHLENELVDYEDEPQQHVIEGLLALTEEEVLHLLQEPEL